jgi:LemA protein
MELSTIVSVNLNNVRIEQFPDLLLARLMGFKSFDLLEFAASRGDIDLAKLFA